MGYVIMKKGITPVIAIVLLLMITIAIIGLAFAFFTGFFSTVTDDTGQGVEDIVSDFQRGIRLESVTVDAIYLRNTGASPISGADLYIYLNDEQIEFTLDNDIEAGDVGTLTVSEPLADTDTVRVNYGILKDSIKIELDIEKGLIAHYKFDNNARDNIGGNHGMVVGSVPYVSDAERGAVASFGDGNYIDLGNPSDFEFITGRPDLSITAWVKANSFAQYKGFITNSENGQHDGGVKFGIGYGSSSEGTVRVDWEDDTSLQNSYTSIASSFNVPNKWYHVVITASSEELKIYLDGDQSGIPGSVTNDLGTQVASWKIGTNYGAYEDSYSWNGYIDDVRFYNRVLSAGEVKTLFLE
ncbi:hypothetical protein CL614_02020 [archaeon]|nr:hypothetical protein [archaeon]|tara:strand:- start:1143 stop:2207 length:1065 start_codon:yes stop_codon:yes gene_type:complete